MRFLTILLLLATATFSIDPFTYYWTINLSGDEATVTKWKNNNDSVLVWAARVCDTLDSVPRWSSFSTGTRKFPYMRIDSIGSSYIDTVRISNAYMKWLNVGTFDVDSIESVSIDTLFTPWVDTIRGNPFIDSISGPYTVIEGGLEVNNLHTDTIFNHIYFPQQITVLGNVAAVGGVTCSGNIIASGYVSCDSVGTNDLYCKRAFADTVESDTIHTIGLTADSIRTTSQSVDRIHADKLYIDSIIATNTYFSNHLYANGLFANGQMHAGTNISADGYLDINGNGIFGGKINVTDTVYCEAARSSYGTRASFFTTNGSDSLTYSEAEYYDSLFDGATYKMRLQTSIVKVGKTVTLSIPQLVASLAGGNYAYLRGVPASYQPADGSLNCVIVIQENSTVGYGFAEFYPGTPTGYFLVVPADGGTFASGQGGVLPQTLTWVTD